MSRAVKIGSFACFGVAMECAASKCANAGGHYSVPRHCALTHEYMQYGRNHTIGLGRMCQSICVDPGLQCTRYE